MCRFSSRSSLLAGVSAVVLAASLGSGAFAQAVDYTYDSSGNIDTWADGTERTGNSGNDIANARAGDNLTLSAGRVLMTPSSRSGASIGILRSGAGSAGRFLLADGRSSAGTLTGRIGKIQKQGSQAVDLYVQNFGRSGSVVEVIVAGDAVVDDLSIDMGRADVSGGSKGKATFGGDLTIEGGVNLNDQGTAGNSRAYLVFNGSADQRILGSGPAKITAAADGEGTIQVLNGVNNAAPRKATFDIEIGANDRRLRQLTVGDTSRGGHAIFNRGVHVDHINVIAGNHTNEQATVEFRGNVSGETIALKDGYHRNFSGSNGRSVDALVIFNASAGDMTVDNKIVGSGFTSDGRPSYGGRLTIIGGRSGSRQHKVIFNKEVGGTGDNRLEEVDVGRRGFAGSAVFKGDVSPLRISVYGDSSAIFEGDANFVIMNVYGGGSAVFKGDVNGNLSIYDGGAGKVAQVTLEKNMAGGSVNFRAGSSTLIIGGAGRLATVNDTGQTIWGSFTGDPGGSGTLIVDNRGDAGRGRIHNNKVTFAGRRIGYPGGRGLEQITLSDGRTTFNGDVRARSITINTGDATVFKRDVTAGTGANEGIKLGATSGSVTFNGTAGQTVAGKITSASGGDYGTIIIANTHADGVTFTGSLGASGANNGLSRVTLNTNVKAAFAGNVYLGNGLTFANGSQVTFNGTTSQTVAGDLTSAAGGNYGTMTIASDVSFMGSLGTNSAKLANLTLRGNATAATASRASFAGNVYLNGNLTLGENTRVTLNGSGDQEISATITNGGTAGRGDIVVNNSGGTVTFANAVGGSGGALKQITLDDGQTVFEGAVYAGTITVNSADGTTFNGAISATTFKFGASATANSRVTFGGSTAQTITPAITTDANNQGAITIANRAGVTFEGDLGTDAARLARLTLDTGTKATLEQSGYLAGNVTIGNGATLIVGDASGVTGTNGRGTTAADAQTITGNIVAGDDGQGNLEIRNRSRHATGRKVSFTGSIGADGRALNRITVADGETTFGGDVYAGNLTITARDATTFRGHVKADREFELDDGSSVTFGGTAGQTVTGNITGASNGNGTIIIDNVHADGVTFGGQLGTAAAQLDSLTVNEGAKVTFTRPVYLSGTLRLKTGTTIALGDGLTTRSDATQPFVTVGDYAFDGDFTEANRVRLILPLSFTSGTQKVFSAHSTLDKEKFTLNGNNLVRYNYEFNNDGTAVTVTAKGFKSLGEVSSKLGTTDTESSMILTVSSFAKKLPTGDPVKKIIEEATRAGNEAQGRRLAAQLKPQMTALGGARRAVLSTGTQVTGMISEHLALQRGEGRRSGLAQSGFATGGDGLDKSLWFKPFGRRGKQAKDKTQTIDGYRTSARGLAMGVDAPVGERGRVGTALAYSTSRITGEGVAQDKTGVRGWQVLVYGDYSTAHYYVEGQVGVGRNDVRTTSRVAVLTRKSAYDTTSLTAFVGGGVPLRLDASTTLTPTAGLSWTRVGSARYTTTGALSLNQKIRVGSIDAVVGTLGTRLQKDITRGNGTLVPVARVGLSYDFAGEQTTARGRFTGGGNRFTVKGAKVKKPSGTAGVGLTYNAPRWSIGADYDLSARPGYTGHSARLNARVKF